jgi:cytochrome c peroxidase
MRVVAGMLALASLASSCVLASSEEADFELAGSEQALANNQEQTNLAGASASFSTAGAVELAGPFFESLGSNGRRCVDCHQPDQGWSITPSRIALSFARSSGRDPVFRAVDGAVFPGADTSTVAARRAAYALLLARGLIRVGLGIPAGAEFSLVAIDDPYGHATSSELSLYRRPLPATNLRFQPLIMWDGRESPAGRSHVAALLQQAEDATLGHAEALLPPSGAQKRAIVDFESALFAAQIRDNAAGALGGPERLVHEGFHVGINDPLGDPVTGAAFDREVFRLFGAWLEPSGSSAQELARAAIARGELLFNTRRLEIRNTAGINDNPEFGRLPVLVGTCSTCHNTPNVGTASTPRFFNIGIGGAGRRPPDVPLYTLRNHATGAEVLTTDPGRALITGRWADVQRFKVPSLRALAARPPYFHNGQSATLEEVVDFYSGRFRMSLSDQERSDLVAFLRAL